MTKSEAQNRITKLKQEIDIHRYNYHVLDQETISPSALDSLKHELFKIEQEFPELITSNSPTQRIGGTPLDKFVKAEHSQPMLSLFDAFSEDDMRDWEQRVKNYAATNGIKLPKLEYYCELKLDGLAVDLKYEQGLLVRGATRGDGRVGENVTQNIKTIESIPLQLKNFSKDIEVRGEAIMLKSTLEKLNKKYIQTGRALLANTRNAAAGSIRQLDSKITAERQLVFYAYELLYPAPTRAAADQLAKKLGFKIVSHNKLCRNLEEVFAFHRYWETRRDKLDFNIDGVVVKINQLDLWPQLGIVGKAPRYAMAYKFSAEQATTKLIDIIWQVGRTGTLTPTAVLDPVKVGGATISRATLHNLDEIRRLGIKIRDTIIIERAGDVIPKVVSVLVNLRTGQEKNISVPKNCPICSSPVRQVADEVAYRCTNKKCYAVTLRGLEHFVSKGALDIDGLGPKIVEQLIATGLIRDAADLFTLKKIDLENLERFAEKSADNLIKAIAERRQIPLARFLYALGIRHIGEESALALAKLASRVKNIQDLIKFLSHLELVDLEQINDFGPVVAKSIYDFFHDVHNLQLLQKLAHNGVQIIVDKPKAGQKNSQISGRSFVLTGSLVSLTRDQAKDKIRELGGKILGAVSKKVDYVVLGAEPGSKYEQARKLGVKILSEEEFKNMFK